MLADSRTRVRARRELKSGRAKTTKRLTAETQRPQRGRRELLTRFNRLVPPTVSKAYLRVLRPRPRFRAAVWRARQQSQSNRIK